MAVASADTLSELLTKRYDPVFMNLVAQDSRIYGWLTKKKLDGDTEYLFKARYAGNASAGSYAELDDLGEAGHQSFMPARVSVKQYKVKVHLSGLIIEATKGAGGFIEAWSDETRNGLEDLKTVMSDDILSDAAPANSGKDHTGIPYIIADTGTYANIDSSTYTWWQSYVDDSGSDRNLTVALMQKMLKNLRNRPRKAKISQLFADEDQWNNYGNLLTGFRRYSAMEKMDAHFKDGDLEFSGIPFSRVDGWPAQRIDFLDKRHWEYRTLLPFKAEPLDVGNYDARSQYFKHYGMVVCTNRRAQGSLQDLNIVPVS